MKKRSLSEKPPTTEKPNIKPLGQKSKKIHTDWKRGDILQCKNQKLHGKAVVMFIQYNQKSNDNNEQTFCGTILTGFRRGTVDNFIVNRFISYERTLTIYPRIFVCGLCRTIIDDTTVTLSDLVRFSETEICDTCYRAADEVK